jgi:hypothetical protein
VTLPVPVSCTGASVVVCWGGDPVGGLEPTSSLGLIVPMLNFGISST